LAFAEIRYTLNKALFHRLDGKITIDEPCH